MEKKENEDEEGVLRLSAKRSSFLVASTGAVWVVSPLPVAELTYWSSLEAVNLYNRCRMYKEDSRTHAVRLEMFRQQNREKVEHWWKTHGSQRAGAVEDNDEWQWPDDDEWQWPEMPWWNGDWWEGQTHSPTSVDMEDVEVEELAPPHPKTPTKPRGVLVAPKPKVSPKVIPSRKQTKNEHQILAEAELDAERRYFAGHATKETEEPEMNAKARGSKDADPMEKVEPNSSEKTGEGEEQRRRQREPEKDMGKKENAKDPEDDERLKEQTLAKISAEKKIQDLKSTVEKNAKEDRKKLKELQEKERRREKDVKRKKTEKKNDSKSDKDVKNKKADRKDDPPSGRKRSRSRSHRNAPSAA